MIAPIIAIKPRFSSVTICPSSIFSFIRLIIATIARAVFGSSDPNNFEGAENLSLYEDQPFLQNLFSPTNDCSYARIPTILLGYPFTKKTPEDVIHARLTVVVSAMVRGNVHTDRLVKNTLSSLEIMSQSFQSGPLPKFRIYWISSHLFYGGGVWGAVPPR